jgi:hypothetical protein
VAWAEVLIRPRHFFRTKVAPGDQAPGLTFAAAVVLAAETVRIAAFGGAYPVVSGRPVASAVFWVLLVTVLIAPAGIHLTAAVQTVLLIATIDERAGVSETVQVLCYALAPCVLVGIPDVRVQAVATLWGAGLLVVGMASVHDVPVPTALPVVAGPALLVFGYGFGGVEAITTVGAEIAAGLDRLAD